MAFGFVVGGTLAIVFDAPGGQALVWSGAAVMVYELLWGKRE